LDKSDTGAENTRLDKWLWAARFFKTRQLAADAVRSGHIEVNGHRAKPGRGVRVDDAVTIQRGQHIFDIVILQLSARRGPATEARKLYLETEASRAERERLAGELKTQATQILYDPKRPSRQDRRKGRTHKRDRC